MNTIIALVLSFLAGVSITWLVSQRFWASYYNPIIEVRDAQLKNWNEHSIKLEAELRQLAADMMYNPEVIGMAITEPEEVLHENHGGC